MRILGKKKHKICEKIMGKNYDFCKVSRRDHHTVMCWNRNDMECDIVDVKEKKFVRTQAMIIKL